MRALEIICYKLLFYLILKYAQTAALIPKGPCENFYAYACSNYSRDNPDPNYGEITQKLNFEMNKILMKHLRNSLQYHLYSRKQTYYDKMGLYLESCKRETKRELRKYFKEIKPSNKLNWPLLDGNQLQWLATDMNFDLWSLLGQLQSYGLNNIIVNMQIVRNKDNKLNIWLTPAVTEEKEDELNERQIWQVLLKTLGIQNIETILQQLINTDLEWQNLRLKYSNNFESKVTNLENIAKIYPKLNLKLYFENLLGKEVHNLANITVENLQYFEHLNQKLWTAEELEHLCNYLMVKFLLYLAKDSTTGFKPLECIKDLRQKFDLAVNYIFYHYPFFRKQHSSKITLDKLAQEIKEIMTKYFNENHLNLSKQQINYLQNKLKHIYINQGNLPININFTMIDKYYQDLPQLAANNYYRNHLLLLKHRFHKSLYYAQHQTHFIVSDNRLGAITSAYYVAQQNMIVIPLDNFALPFFDSQQTPLQQLSVFGFVLAHELTHAFDTTGLNYDQKGLLLPFSSDILVNANFSNSLDCLQHQQPTEDIDECIADLFAIRVAYRTYLEYYSENHKGDWRKEFFMNLAQFFCAKDNVNFIDHNADDVRLQQILMNFQSFSEAFDCLPGTFMNPKTKCRLY
ncbi:endothelin-converting enzyme homolog [Lucilia sericata]|uniref:endothelin-converting enzyme homolog n=1 Tax=Lucilia sericata TaxID=13632 RepID=UPI0018A7E947|nr:endothelin-converting enzyme homolog [Lucilia sericata]